MPDDPKMHRTSPRVEGTRLVSEAGAPESPGQVSRRSFIKTVGVSAAASSLAAAASASGVLGKHLDEPEAKPSGSGAALFGPDPINITLNINGRAAQLMAEPATTLLEALRLHLNLTGTKEVCDRGACGACSVIIDGKLVNACMLLAMDCIGTKITTVEGLAADDSKGGMKLDPVQEMFVKHDGMQCGFCTPGMVVASRALLNDTPKPTMYQIKRALSGNICRCGTYTNIFNAVLEASGQPVVMDQRGA
jgi:aerobic-type carbon monoxide dehydrogenase small subunit (CoxS/CutS family)